MSSTIMINTLSTTEPARQILSPTLYIMGTSARLSRRRFCTEENLPKVEFSWNNSINF